MTEGTIIQLSASNGGVPKRAIDVAVVNEGGFTVDHQADLRAHGGPRRALCLYSIEQIMELRSEGHNVDPGTLGENITTHGFNLGMLPMGSRLRLGERVLIEFTEHTSPCSKNAHWFVDENFERINHALFPGSARLYARVIEGGELRPGDRVEVVPDTAAERVLRLQPKTYRWRPPS